MTLGILLLADCDRDEFLSQIASESQGHVGSDLVTLCSEAALQQIREKMDFIDIGGEAFDDKVLSSLAVSQGNFRASNSK